MQRAAASPPSTPSQSSPKTYPSPADARPAKRQRRDDAATEDAANTKLMQAAMAAAEAERTRILDRQAAEAGDTKWSLDNGAGASSPAATSPFAVVSASYGELDSPRLSALSRQDEDESYFPGTPTDAGRRRFGRFGEKQEVSLCLAVGSDDSCGATDMV